MDTAAAWELFHAGEEPRGVRGEVLTSWRRSRISGVDPEYVDPPFVETDFDTHFTRVAVPIMEGMAELLVGDGSCLALADARGSVVWRWVSEPTLRGKLDRLSVAQGFCFDEEFVGTNGLGTALETGAIAVVRGSEHFVQRFHDVTCVAAPVRHPITRRMAGAVNLTCRAEHTNPLLTVVVRRLVGEIEEALVHGASTRERQLLTAFLVAQRGTSGPVITVGHDLVIANPAATELGLDLRDLWDDVRDRADGTLVDLPSALPAGLSARLRLVRDGSATAGAVLTVTAPPARPPTPPAPPDRWAQLVAQAGDLLTAGPLAVRGEAGTGRATLLAQALGGPLEVDAAMCPVEGITAFSARLTDHTRPLLLRHVELLTAAAAQTVAAVLAGHPRLGLTASENGPAPLLDRLAASTITLTPLRHHAGDVLDLARRELRRVDERLSFSPEARTALRRHDWPGNGPELARVVRDAARHAQGGVVGLAALPPEVRAAAGGRALSPLERAESDTIAAVLAGCGGNKSAAARELGISRTALYAKLRSYRL